MNEEIKNRLKELIEEDIRPGLVMDGGDIELVEITDDGVVKVRLKGACAHCPFSRMTLAHRVEQTLKQRFAEVRRVEAVL